MKPQVSPDRANPQSTTDSTPVQQEELQSRSSQEEQASFSSEQQAQANKTSQDQTAQARPNGSNEQSQPNPNLTQASTSNDSQASESHSSRDPSAARAPGAGGPGSPGFNPLDYETQHQKDLQKKIPGIFLFMVILLLQMGVPSLGADAFIPAINNISQDFATSLSGVQAFVALFFVGGGLGQFFWGPFADRYGRVATLVIAGLIGMFANILFAISSSYNMAVVSRILQGFFTTGVSVIGTVALKDVFSPRKFIKYNTILLTFFMFVPALAPILGGYIYVSMGWRAIFYILTFLLGCSILIYVAKIPETLNPRHVQAFRAKTVLSNYFSILKNPTSVLLIFINVIFSTAILNVPTLLPNVFINEYGVAPEHFGYYTLSIVIVVMVGLQLNHYFISKHYNPLKVTIWGSFIQFLFLSLNVIVAYQLFGVHLAIPTIMLAIFFNVLLNGLQIGNIFGFYLMDYPKMIGTATAFLIGIRLVIPGLILAGLSYLPTYHGKTILLINASMLAITFISIMIYYAVFTKFGKNFARKVRA